MSFDGNEGGFIPTEEGTGYTSNHRDAHPESLNGFFFGRKMLEKLLAQDGAMGIRVYYGQDNEGNQKMVLAAAGEDEGDIIGLVGDKGLPCPPRCKGSVLNSK